MTLTHFSSYIVCVASNGNCQKTVCNQATNHSISEWLDLKSRVFYFHKVKSDRIDASTAITVTMCVKSRKQIQEPHVVIMSCIKCSKIIDDVCNNAVG